MIHKGNIREKEQRDPILEGAVVHGAMERWPKGPSRRLAPFHAQTLDIESFYTARVLLQYDIG